MKANIPTPEAKHPYWWVSYCDMSKPAGEHFLGAIVVQCAHEDEAIGEASKVEGGPAHGCPIPALCLNHRHIDTAVADIFKDQEFRVDYRANRWIPREEVLAEACQDIDGETIK